MKIHSALSRSADTAEAASSVCREVAIAIGDHGVDLAFVFFSPDNVPSLSRLINIVRDHLRPKFLLAGSAEAIMEASREIKGQRALGRGRLHWPGTSVKPF